MLLPALSSAKQKAQSIKCLSNLRQWGLAFTMYSQDNGDHVPEEGNSSNAIDDPGTKNGAGVYTTSDNLDGAWYNAVAPTISQPPLVRLYGAFGNAFNPEQCTAGAPVRDHEAEEKHAAPYHKEATSELAQQMVGATI